MVSMVSMVSMVKITAYQVVELPFEQIEKLVDVDEIVGLADTEVVIEGHVVEQLRVFATP